MHNFVCFESKADLEHTCSKQTEAGGQVKTRFRELSTYFTFAISSTTLLLVEKPIVNYCFAQRFFDHLIEVV
jgi:hypothetical protein